MNKNKSSVIPGTAEIELKRWIKKLDEQGDDTERRASLTATIVRSEPDFAKLLRDGEGRKAARSTGGKTTADAKRAHNKKRNDKMKKQAEELFKNGRAPHEIPGILARQYGLSKIQVRRIVPRRTFK